MKSSLKIVFLKVKASYLFSQAILNKDTSNLPDKLLEDPALFTLNHVYNRVSLNLKLFLTNMFSGFKTWTVGDVYNKKIQKEICYHYYV